MELPINPEEQQTPEQVQRSISAAFDSVNLINQLKSQPSLTEEEQDRVNRNIEHLRIMLSKEWFFDGLTEQQKIDINSCLV
jgi:hypothetical protein